MPQDYIDLINTTGVVGILVLVIFVTLVGLYRGWWVPGPFYRELKADKEKLEATNDGYAAHFKTITDVQVAMKAQQETSERETREVLRDILDSLREHGGNPPARRGTR